MSDFIYIKALLARYEEDPSRVRFKWLISLAHFGGVLQDTLHQAGEQGIDLHAHFQNPLSQKHMSESDWHGILAIAKLSYEEGWAIYKYRQNHAKRQTQSFWSRIRAFFKKHCGRE